ncbi:MAG: bifunctional DNA-formamidopyrimidine glycosylase/DNA-(apurinic or apyrimidinic site) lyase [Thermoleophilia bacterium]|nr:bifunctional DNA-formamidopyrimidine glycosylase/DNA-(apurinic or apyrimidinic site) lyase [Thermoleophilia bacterium]
MPELPEVETIRRQLSDHVVGGTITGVRVYDPSLVAPLGVDEFERRLSGRTVESVGRVGKYLLVELDGGEALTLHLRMTGQLLWTPAPPDAPIPYARATMWLDGGSVITFADPRRFGRAGILPAGPARAVAWAGRTGVDALSPTFTAQSFGRSLTGRRAGIKGLILDQRLLAGVGNIYADEALFRARIHPERPGGTLSPEEVPRLHRAIRNRLRVGISVGGTSFDRYRDAHGERGGMQDLLLVHRREGEPCPRCRTTIEKGVVAQRGTYWCPRCQPTGRDAC